VTALLDRRDAATAEVKHGGAAEPAAAPFPPRPAVESWPRTRLPHAAAARLLTSPPFAGATAERRSQRRFGVGLLLDWLCFHSGSSWQQRWYASGADHDPAGWRGLLGGWAAERGHGPWRQEAMIEALPVAVSADLLRPSLPWLVGGGLARGGRLVANLETSRDPDGFARLRSTCATDPHVSGVAANQTVYRAAVILAAKGGLLADVVVGDVLELLDTEAAVLAHSVTRGAVFYRLLRSVAGFPGDAPATLRALRTAGQLSPDQMIDRYGLACRPVRDLLVDYLRERQPALDYTSLNSLAHFLGKLFWADLERHHPGIDSLMLPREVADSWKRRLRTLPRTTTSAGQATTETVERINYRECLTPVRAFYLDLAHWAVEEPGRWARWVAPCPVGAEEVNRKKANRRRKARMDARTRDRLPVLPVLARSVAEHRHHAAELLDAARAALPGAEFTTAGTTLVRCLIDRGEPGRIWSVDPSTGKRRDLSREEDHAFWAWATVEVLRATGIRVEELTELSHHSLVQYRLPTTGELVPLLQIAPSKTDTERLLVVSPELADVLAAIISRVRSNRGALPPVAAYDQRERIWAPPAPLLFQHPVAGEQRAITACGIRQLLHEALNSAGLTDPADGRPLHYTPHDFRRMFITDAIANGLPPHIAQVIAGHQDINVTLGYKAVYPEEQIQSHLAFLARRRALRPSEEYRAPNDEEWQEFLGHFERRKVSIGTCARAFSTPCVHEHACVRCPMLWPDPTQQDRLAEIRDNLHARIAEAEREGWLGEIEGLRVSLAGAEHKLAQIDQRPTGGQPTHLGMPTITMRAAGNTPNSLAENNLGQAAG